MKRKKNELVKEPSSNHQEILRESFVFLNELFEQIRNENTFTEQQRKAFDVVKEKEVERLSRISKHSKIRIYTELVPNMRSEIVKSFYFKILNLALSLEIEEIKVKHEQSIAAYQKHKEFQHKLFNIMGYKFSQFIHYELDCGLIISDEVSLVEVIKYIVSLPGKELDYLSKLKETPGEKLPEVVLQYSLNHNIPPEFWIDIVTEILSDRETIDIQINKIQSDIEYALSPESASKPLRFLGELYVALRNHTAS